MKETLEKANQALLEGDRAGVLEYLHNEPDTPEVLWLRAQAVELDEERIHLLTLLAGEESPYSQLAATYVKREKQFTKDLGEPPDYQFWKQPSWERRFEKMRAYRLWVAGGFLLFFFGILGGIANNKYTANFNSEVATAQVQQTAQAQLTGKPYAQYPEGIVSIIDVEDPVDTLRRPVTFGEEVDEKLKPAEPAKGARFVSVYISFQCEMNTCSEPPEAALGLLLADGNYTSLYKYSSRPFFVDAPPNPDSDRISKGQSIKLWFVFEVSRQTSPKSLIVSPPNLEPLFVTWPILP